MKIVQTRPYNSNRKSTSIQKLSLQYYDRYQLQSEVLSKAWNILQKLRKIRRERPISKKTHVNIIRNHIWIEDHEFKRISALAHPAFWTKLKFLGTIGTSRSWMDTDVRCPSNRTAGLLNSTVSYTTKEGPSQMSRACCCIPTIFYLLVFIYLETSVSRNKYDHNRATIRASGVLLAE
jgi:hypothetical protein